MQIKELVGALGILSVILTATPALASENTTTPEFRHQEREEKKILRKEYKMALKALKEVKQTAIKKAREEFTQSVKTAKEVRKTALEKATTEAEKNTAKEAFRQTVKLAQEKFAQAKKLANEKFEADKKVLMEKYKK